MNILEKVKEQIKQYQMIEYNDTIIIGVSGGADSICLLFILAELIEFFQMELIVVHVYHNIRIEGIKDAKYVEEVCRRKKIKYYFYDEQVADYAKDNRLSIEEAGRIIRYQCFFEVKHKLISEGKIEHKVKIAVAHNQNDRAETMLFQLFRGSGLQGIIGMLPIREDIIRPLLSSPREVIEKYLQEGNIKYCIDITNTEDTYTRNKIRNKILPIAINQISKHTVAHMSSASDILWEAQEYLTEQMEYYFSKCVTCIEEEENKRLAIDLLEFNKVHIYLQKEILRHGIGEMAGSKKNITARHIQDCLKLAKKIGNRTISLPYSLVIRQEYDILVIEKKRNNQQNINEENKSIELPLVLEKDIYEIKLLGIGTLKISVDEYNIKNKNNFIENKYTKCFDYDKIKGILCVRKRGIGDIITITKMGNHQSIKKFMIQKKIPQKIRDEIWMLADSEEVLWILGYRKSLGYEINADTKRILRVQLEEA